jgi:hypothetical protein
MQSHSRRRKYGNCFVVFSIISSLRPSDIGTGGSAFRYRRPVPQRVYCRPVPQHSLRSFPQLPQGTAIRMLLSPVRGFVDAHDGLALLSCPLGTILQHDATVLSNRLWYRLRLCLWWLLTFPSCTDFEEAQPRTNGDARAGPGHK